MRSIIIPARGGSKGIPRKNVMSIWGEPLITRCVRTCLKSQCGPVIVSTDDLEIADYAERAGAIICWRPSELAEDWSHVSEALLHCLAQYPCDEVVVAQCTAPLLTHQDVSGTLAALTEQVDLAICGIPFHGVVSDGFTTLNYWPSSSPNRQERGRQWLVSGHCWAFRPSYLDRPWLSGCLSFHRATTQWHLEIDSMDDVELARRLMRPEPVEYPT